MVGYPSYFGGKLAYLYQGVVISLFIYRYIEGLIYSGMKVRHCVECFQTSRCSVLKGFAPDGRLV